MEKESLKAVIEALLFAKGEVVEIKDIASVTGESEEKVKEASEELKGEYAEKNRGISIINVQDGIQMCTSPVYFDYVRRLYAAPKKKQLSQTLLETLAIIAYRQPVTKGQIEEIRGVNADHSVNKLVEYGFVCEMGRLDAPGRPLLFGTTEEFLRFFGFGSIESLPGTGEDEEKLRKEAEEEVGES